MQARPLAKTAQDEARPDMGTSAVPMPRRGRQAYRLVVAIIVVAIIVVVASIVVIVPTLIIPEPL